MPCQLFRVIPFYRGPGNGSRHPHLHDASGGAGPREDVSGIDAGSVPVLSVKRQQFGTEIRRVILALRTTGVYPYNGVYKFREKLSNFYGPFPSQLYP